MPRNPEPTSSFRHQCYSSNPPAAAWRRVVPEPVPAAGTPEFAARMYEVGQRLRRAGMAAIYLAHGTFAGADSLGLLTQLGRVHPSLAERLREVAKGWVDDLAGGAGNYTQQYCELFDQAINRGQTSQIPVRRFLWSSENHHIGRADGAIRLLDELASRHLAAGDRVLCWGHSHAGNVLALMTNLLGGDAASVERFFDAARWYYRWPIFGRCDAPHWSRVRDLLLDNAGRGGSATFPFTLDVATFGAPIRYGWQRRGFGRLIHFVNHRPGQQVAEYLAAFPPGPGDVAIARDGDYVQQLGIAGTNWPPGWFDPRTWVADKRLGRLLEAGVRPRNLIDRWRQGQRVADAGKTLLVDYGPASEPAVRHLAGHAVYTRDEWLLFHAEAVADEYDGADESAASVGAVEPLQR